MTRGWKCNGELPNGVSPLHDRVASSHNRANFTGKEPIPARIALGMSAQNLLVKIDDRTGHQS
jgi:hypothetical protein